MKRLPSEITEPSCRSPWPPLPACLIAGIWIFAALWFFSEPAYSASCSRPISAAYLSTELDDAFDAKPYLNLPALEQAISDSSGCVIDVKVYPSARVWRQFVAGKLDMVIGGVETETHNAAGQFLPIARGNWVLLATSSTELARDHLEEFTSPNNVLIGVTRGYGFPSDVAGLIGTLRQHHQIDESTDLSMAVRKLVGGRNALLLTDELSYSLSPNRPELSAVRVLPQTRLMPAVSGIYLSAHSLSEQDRQALTDSIQAVLTDGLIDRLIQARVTELTQVR